MTAELRPVEEIRVDLEAMGQPPTVYRRFAVDAEFRRDDVCERLLDDVEPLLARLAAADRENAELRGEVERLREGYRVVCDQAERADLLQSQLAAAQAQLARLLRIFDGINDAIHNETLTEFSRLVAVSALKNAALLAAPQPEPTHFEITVEGNGALSTRPAFQPEPPASDEPTGRSD